VCNADQTCVAGACKQPAELAIVGGLSAPVDLALDSTRVYWTDAGTLTVGSAPKTGGSPSTLASAQQGADRIAVDDTYVYWTAGGDIRRTSKGGGGSVTTVVSGAHPGDFVLDATNVYWVSTVDGQVESASKAGGAVAQLAATTGTQLVTDGTSLYTLQDSGQIPQDTAILKIAKTGGITSTVLTQGGRSLLANGSTIFLYSQHFGTHITLPFTTPNPTPSGTISSNLPSPLHLSAADGCNLYTGGGCTGGVGGLAVIHGGGQPISVVQRGLQDNHMVVDDTYVYWTDGGGFIGRLHPVLSPGR
jgi:hypothetical protein